ncbi:MAG: exodeoxyribonuclease III [PS1 clade bacterium]|nr:exodeoxyribonuclease III [PS1 clade bacterium]
MRIVSWNINSVRLREKLVVKLMKKLDPDVICLQETKCPNDQFPEKAFAKAGFAHIAKNGIKGYHGVATLSKHEILDSQIVDYCKKGDGRHIAVTLKGAGKRARPVTVHNFYVPAGGDEPDPQVNEKFAHKLAFLAEMKKNFKKMKKTGKAASQVLLGDLNIAPGEHDVWSSKQLKNVVSHTAVEIAELAEVLGAADWDDVARRFVPPQEKLYSWWSYRARDWAASDRGRRLDHIWVTPDLSDAVHDYGMLRAARGWERPSDHAPVWIDLKD